MSFSGYHLYFPEKAKNETRRITLLEQEGELEPNTYTFLEMYCTESDCDCRRAMIKVFDEQNNFRATLSYGWESRDYYIDWMGDEVGIDDMPGVNVYSLQQQGKGYLDLKEKLQWVIDVDPAYAERLQEHYSEFKNKVESGTLNQAKPVRVIKTGRNEPCPCGSGKKYKKCCQREAVLN